MSVPWIKPEELVEFEFRQAEEEGRDVTPFAQEWAAYRERHPEEGSSGKGGEPHGVDGQRVPDDNPAEPSVSRVLLRPLPRSRLPSGGKAPPMSSAIAS